MRKLIITLFALALNLSVNTAPVHAQGSSSINIAGLNFYCNANNGARVPIYFTENAWRGGGAMAGIDPYRGFYIDVSPNYLYSLNQYAAAYVFLHECAHVALPFGVGLASPSQEMNADCYAIRQMRNLRLINNPYEFNAAVSAVANMPGSPAGHLPGPARIRHLAQCISF
ncbi:hypothetical protein [Ponticaulis sp.]|uniref:hypothetical protein n=1 Tax=Ponticaulis sp. TaxID=2020902 RepID=UPI000B697EA1|nr:hypothetical protein [Ponticaulis sp.]MAJ07956.1 hypothetical protein [Ponticaulis sp.]RPG18265.1 MAG: hypothetical protein CBC85_003280 [Hyphomonadaceae bacterium TMED125]HBH89091.1 hypothetical protein [Hyphomonadaceae bacterium]HBJ92802.1 hypothetical protein [Hyphomonadaceae bacterium]|tara:strand:+ start:15804 stop:16313 length:510 start_codon:yes stop_codon:yes gene_type:complete